MSLDHDIEVLAQNVNKLQKDYLKYANEVHELRESDTKKSEIIANSELCTRIAEMIDIAEIAKREKKSVEDWIIDTLTSAAMISNNQAIKIDGSVAERFSRLAHARGLAISTLTTGENVTKYIDSGFDNLAY